MEVTRNSQHSFTQGKSCLADLVAFYNGVTTSVDKGRATDVIYTDFSEAFDMVPHNILAAKLERYRYVRWTVSWRRNWPVGLLPEIKVNGSMSKWKPVMLVSHEGLCWD